mmetsp:Transcript_24937/g.49917  ORF Transcript_24937/g.49917 Transcript_24937/m.49917 type:complete len:353 (+) Transcript_24937:365-1423(+)
MFQFVALPPTPYACPRTGIAMADHSISNSVPWQRKFSTFLRKISFPLPTFSSFLLSFPNFRSLPVLFFIFSLFFLLSSSKLESESYTKASAIAASLIPSLSAIALFSFSLSNKLGMPSNLPEDEGPSNTLFFLPSSASSPGSNSISATMISSPSPNRALAAAAMDSATFFETPLDAILLLLLFPPRVSRPEEEDIMPGMMTDPSLPGSIFTAISPPALADPPAPGPAAPDIREEAPPAAPPSPLAIAPVKKAAPVGTMKRPPRPRPRPLPSLPLPPSLPPRPPLPPLPPSRSPLPPLPPSPRPEEEAATAVTEVDAEGAAGAESDDFFAGRLTGLNFPAWVGGFFGGMVEML